MPEPQICMCGAFAGYLHGIDCPYPLFYVLPGSERESRWWEERLRRLERYANPNEAREQIRDERPLTGCAGGGKNR